MHPTLTRRRLAFAAALAILLVPACGGPSMNPKVDRARGALEAALGAWREGKKPGAVPGADPPVQVVDNDWTNGRKLDGFEILRETPSDTDKRFVVKLTYSGQAPAETTYVVVGVSPIVVFREEDYVRTMNMDNNPIPAKKGR